MSVIKKHKKALANAASGLGGASRISFAGDKGDKASTIKDNSTNSNTISNTITNSNNTLTNSGSGSGGDTSNNTVETIDAAKEEVKRNLVAAHTSFL